MKPSSFKIIDLIEKGNQIEVKIKSESDRYRYLENNPLETKFLISFDEGRITSIEDLGSETADWVLWRSKVDTLVDWTKVHHPELDGFIFDISMMLLNSNLIFDFTFEIFTSPS